MSSNKNNKTELMEQGPIKRTLLTLAIPTIIATIINAVYNFVDTLFVGMLHDTAAMGAVSVAFPLFMILGAIGQMVGVGAGSYISRSLGAKDKGTADKTATTALFLAIILGIVATVGILMFLEPILMMMGATASILVPGKSYSVWIVGGALFTVINMTLNNIIRAEGNVKYSMNALIIGAVLNILFDPLFMFALKLGLEGAAIATVLGQFVSTLYLLKYFIGKKKSSYVTMSMKNISRERKIYAEICKIGLPVFFMQFLSSMAFGLQNVAASAYGEDALAAIGISLKITMIPLFVMIGYNLGFQPFAAYNYGAKNYDRVREGLHISVTWIMAFGFVALGVFLLFPVQLMRIFSQDQKVIEYGVNNLLAYNIFLPLIGYMTIHTGLFQSFGKGKQAAVLAIVRQGLFFIPLLLIFPRLFEAYSSQLAWVIQIFPYTMQAGLAGIMVAQPVADLLSIILTAAFAYSIKKEISFEDSKGIKKADEGICQK
ncbi:MAG: MATE family efflux transporter [Sphaerochaeta sp.]|nr:MATE family efflux transporter [Sphaerochaeta sp.]